MANILISVGDFAGYFQTNLNTANTPVLQSYIDRYEKQGILKLLGTELGLLFIADLSNPTQDARFAVIQDEFDLTLNQQDMSSRGMIDYLVSYIYYHYTKDRAIRKTDVGPALATNEAETILSPREAAREGENKYNEAIETVRAIQWYCTTYAPATYPDDEDRQYPEFNGETFEYFFNPIF